MNESQLAARLSDTSSFRHWVREAIRFSDQDSSGRVTSTAYLSFAEAGRLAFVYGVLLPERAAGERFILARNRLRSLADAHWPGEVSIGTCLTTIGTRSLTVGSGLFVAGRPIGWAEAVIAYRRDGQTAALGEALRARLTALLHA
ncbi:MAG: hypothetical protein FJX68_15275 [Alphaproteobacteria bacterium]|nr:hypothetical protein [Alphaproteobacteria bacterium]